MDTTDRSKKVMFLADQEAKRLRHTHIGGEHILLGLIKEGSGVAANVLVSLGIDTNKMRQAIENVASPGTEEPPAGRLTLNPQGKRIIVNASHQAQLLRHQYVGTEHLLLALLHEREEPMASVFAGLKLQTEDVRSEILHTLGHAPLPDLWPAVRLHEGVYFLALDGEGIDAAARILALLPGGSSILITKKV